MHENEHLWQWLVLSALLFASIVSLGLHFFPNLKKLGRQKHSRPSHGCAACRGCEQGTAHIRIAPIPFSEKKIS